MDDPYGFDTACGLTHSILNIMERKAPSTEQGYRKRPSTGLVRKELDTIFHTQQSSDRKMVFSAALKSDSYSSIVLYFIYQSIPDEIKLVTM